MIITDIITNIWKNNIYSKTPTRIPLNPTIPLRSRKKNNPRRISPGFSGRRAAKNAHQRRNQRARAMLMAFASAH